MPNGWIEFEYMGQPNAQHARQILDLCRHGLARLTRNPMGDDWLFDYTATVTLLRSVGYVLEKVDTADPRIKAAQAVWWRQTKSTKSQSRIFWGFIDEDRHLFLKEGVVRAGQSATISIAGVEARVTVAGEHYVSSPLGTVRLPEPKYSYDMNSGPFAGRDPRQVIQEAIDWWQQQLTQIESDAKAQP